MQKPQLIQVNTKDGLTLPGLLYSSSKSKKVAIYLHGNGSSSIFYSDDLRDGYASELLKRDISFLPLNNRGSNYIKKLSNTDAKIGYQRYGMAYEIIKECIFDINACIDFLKQKGFEEFYLIGESTGANKICVYDYYEKSNPVAGYILLGGGDDVGIYYDQLGERVFWKLLKEARKKMADGKGNDIIKSLLPSPIFSHKGFYDIANPDGDYNVFPFYEVINDTKLSKNQPLFKMYNSLKKPTYTVYGDKDEYAWGDVSRVVDILKNQNPQPTYAVIKGANHEFTNHREKLGRMMANWLNNLNERKL